MKHRALLCVACMALMTPASAQALQVAHNRGAADQAQESLDSVQTLSLDSYFGWDRHYTPPVATSLDLRRDHYAVATVSGTFSFYAALNYAVPQRPWTVVCGSPERSAQYQGSLGGDGPAGLDAEFIFARPWTAKECASAHLPIRWPNFQINDGTGWGHPKILGTLPIAPTTSHTYSFAAVGHNQRLRFRLSDIWTRDNYGLLKISLRPATTADCSSYQAFGFRSSSSCMGALS
jgi:hypothetical protein